MGKQAWVDVRRAFDEAAAWYVGTTCAAEGRWNHPGLGVWTVRDLVGHTSRSLVTVEAYLDAPVEGVDVPTAAEYFRVALASIADPEAVAQRGRDAGAALGDAVPAAVTALWQRVAARLDAADPQDLVGTPVGGMRLADYLPTRTFELTVHTADLCAALGLPLEVPPAAGVASLALVSELAATGGSAGALLLAATGRRGLPAGFTVLQPAP